MENQEIEVKLFVNRLWDVEKRLISNGGRLIQPRVLETNLRFDTQASELARSFRVLRLRRDNEIRITYKGPGTTQEGARIREEIEFVVADFERARKLFEALGYQVSFTYEKYRTTYDLQAVHISLDELPYGSFVEIEGPDIESLQSVNRTLELKWESSVPASYTELFHQLVISKGLEIQDLTFENFLNLPVTAEDLGVVPAD
jgi:adenylate cyclase, class 2